MFIAPNQALSPQALGGFLSCSCAVLSVLHGVRWQRAALRIPGRTSPSMSLGNTKTPGKAPKPRQLWWPKGPTSMPQISQITKQAAKQTQILD